MIPANATLVGGFGGTGLRSSSLYPKYLPMLLAQAGPVKMAIESMKASCNIDVLGMMDSAVFGLDDAGTGTLVVTLERANRPVLDACATKLTVELDWLAADTFAWAIGKPHGSGSVEKRALAAVDKSSTIWAVGTRTMPLGDGSLKSFSLTAQVAAKRIEIDAHLVTDRAQTASAFSTSVTSQIFPLVSFGRFPSLTTVSVTSAGANVVATASLAEDDVLSLLAKLP
ncbi:MAG TPA: hypothetical protein VGC41_08755 [Kofleriaceae bacterium]